VGDRIDARVTNIDKKDRKLSLSVKAHEVAEEKQAMAEYGSSSSGASLGDILGAALSRAREDGTEDDVPVAEEAPVEAEAAPEPEAAPEAEAAPAADDAAKETSDDAAPADAGEGDEEKP
jgi:small subunit ribosomal protein S1